MIKCAGMVFFAVVCAAMDAFAGATASQWVIVVNGQSVRSRTIANYYTHWRNIPPLNVISLDDIPDGRTISMVDFRARILKPVLEEIERRKLFPHIQGIAYSSDFPVVVDLADEPKPQGEQAQYLTPAASITGATYLYRLVLDGGTNYLALGNNFYAQRPAIQLFQTPLGDPESEIETRKKSLQEKRDYYRLAELYDEQLKEQPHQFPVSYASAQAWAMAGESAKSLQRLQQAIETGWSYSKYTQDDIQLERLREYSRFQALVRGCEDDEFDWTPAVAFDARKFYSPNGVGGFVPKMSVAYILSFSLAVCMERGNTQEEVLKQLKTSIDADFTQPKGAFYFTKTDDIRTKCREPNFKIACDRLKKLGFECEITTEAIPTGKTCLGVTMGVADFDWGASKSKLVPGALGDNLTSWGAMMETSNQTKLSEFLRHGAAASSGTVTEPFAIPAKFPHPAMHASYAAGLTAAEAYYSALPGPYQLLIAGDPLCQPFAKPPKFKVVGIKEGDRIGSSVSVELHPADDPQSVNPKDISLLLDGQFHGKLGFPSRLSISNQKVSNGAHELRLIGTDETRIESRWEAAYWILFGSEETHVRFSGPKTWKASDRKPLVVNVIGSNPRNPIEIRHDKMKIVTVETGKATCEIPVDKLGTGPVRLQAVEFVGTAENASMPITVMIE